MSFPGVLRLFDPAFLDAEVVLVAGVDGGVVFCWCTDVIGSGCGVVGDQVCCCGKCVLTPSLVPGDLDRIVRDFGLNDKMCVWLGVSRGG